jgi:hypothetical protein
MAWAAWAYDERLHSPGFNVSDPDLAVLRRHMVAEIAARTIFLTARLGKAALDRRVLDVMGRVPRHEFVRLALQPLAYTDMPLPNGYGKTISQPFIVALMTDLLALQQTDIVLEVGTGLGYQTAILAALAQHVYSVELIDELAIEARTGWPGRAAPTSTSALATAAPAGPITRRSTRSSSPRRLT